MLTPELLRSDPAGAPGHLRALTRWFVGAWIASLMVPGSASAQTGQAAFVFATGWEMFERRCKLALEDPGAFIASVPPRGPLGVSAFAQSTDKQILSAREYYGEMVLETSISGVGGYRMIGCNINAWVPMGNAPSGLGAEIAAQVKALFTARSDLPLNGGAIPMTYAESNGTEQYIYSDTAAHAFVSVVNWGGSVVPISIGVGDHGYEIHGRRIEGGPP